MHAMPITTGSRLLGPRAMGLAAVFVLSVASSTQAQVAVYDPGVFVQLVRTLQQAEQQYAVVQRQREIWTRLARPLPSGRQGRYVIPATPWSLNRTSPLGDPFGSYTPLRGAIEHGDPTGAQWRRSVAPLAPYPSAVLTRMTPRQRLYLAREWTHPRSADGLALVGMHALGYNREGHQAASRALDQLSGQLRTGDRGNIALHQQLAATEIAAAREEHLHNVYLAYLLEDLLADMRRLRDGLTQRMNRQIYVRTHGSRAAQQTTAETERVLRDFWMSRP